MLLIQAMERMPEAFFPVHMLYVRIKVNGVPAIAFIDSGMFQNENSFKILVESVLASYSLILQIHSTKFCTTYLQ